MAQKQPSFTCSLVSGGIAGTSVDVALFPLDTIKTRLQSPQGFFKAGGFKGIYNGLSSAAAGSAPGAALFFTTYEAVKGGVSNRLGEGAKDAPWLHMLAGSCGEVMACLVRVPTDNVKQKLQAGTYSSARACISGIVGSQGPAGFYAGYLTTVMREIPFSAIQFPLYEGLKRKWGEQQGAPVNSLQAGLCGSFAGSIAAAVTTPLDVTKTRLMLGHDKNGKAYSGMVSTMGRIYADEGAQALLSGIVPRVFWISIGGAVFLGCYEKAKVSLIDIV